MARWEPEAARTSPFWAHGVEGCRFASATAYPPGQRDCAVSQTEWVGPLTHSTFGSASNSTDWLPEKIRCVLNPLRFSSGYSGLLCSP